MQARGRTSPISRELACRAMPVLRYMIIDTDGQRIGRFESSQLEWKPGDTFVLEERSWRIVEILPEVSTMVAYNAVWVAAPI